VYEFQDKVVRANARNDFVTAEKQQTQLHKFYTTITSDSVCDLALDVRSELTVCSPILEFSEALIFEFVKRLLLELTLTGSI